MSNYTLSYTFTRPADTTTYASGDLIADTTTASLVVPLSWSLANLRSRGAIARCRVKRGSSATTGAVYFLHLFRNAPPTVSSGDNAAIVITSGSANYLGGMLTAASQALTDGAVAIGGYLPYVASGPVGPAINYADIGIIYGLLEVRGALVPTSGESFTVTLECTNG